ncbi:MAG: DDE-type integrase/transposase/recombinase, partial [Desulfarculus sp.]|nr:DDE-type integrase/transposase/recombinase [Desulfarculus sp.]
MGWSRDKRMKAKLVCNALRMALWGQRMPEGVVVQWDRGSQFVCGDYQEALRVHGMRCSMNRTGDGRDNAFME